ncbi:MAG: cytochrome c [Rhodocyclaceae bacterium]|jgi:cytochrome c553|nr:cytochrome c [Rhodocyclaceae bacterium]
MNRAPITSAGALALALAWATVPAQAADPAAGQAKAATVCAACHGPDGNSASPDFPRLAGQHEDYLLRALLDYKAGKRKNPIMASQVESLSKADMANLAAWFASQQGLQVKR